MKTFFKQTENIMTVKILSLGFIALLFIIAINSCKHEPPMLPENGNPGGVSGLPGSVGRTCSPDTVYFANQISPLITSTCAMAGCHDAISHKEGVNLSTYSNIMKYVVIGNATSSKLYKEIANGSMPPRPMVPWTAEQKAKLQKWINQGAKNNACDACDTTDFKYSTAIKPLMTNKCQGCHNPASLGGGVDLSTYAGVKASALTGKLYGSIIWSAGISAMPKGGLKMPDCEIKQVKKWIDAGTPNN